MNKVAFRSKREENAKFYYASQKMQKESKIIKLVAYFISFIPIIMSLFPMADKKSLVFAATMFSFGLTVLLEFTSSFLNNHKEKGILLNQLYEAEITGTIFSKTEYDREMTNDLNELAIRKSASKMTELKEFKVTEVPDEVEDKFSYLYLCRQKSASTNYLLSRMQGVYIFILTIMIMLFISFAFVKNDSFEFLQLIIQFYPILIPIIRNIAACSKSMKLCTKLSADIDNYFADGDGSNETRAKFSAYAQTLEFEAMMASPARYAVFTKTFKHGLSILEKGVTKRFIVAQKKLVKKPVRSKIAKIESVEIKEKTEKSKVKPNESKKENLSNKSMQTKTDKKQLKPTKTNKSKD
ncbi:MAG: hypothetical protein IJ538_03275 [Clostridia bacterium]|nr:hypothetical protein [Clostridia bacterium]